MNGRNEENLEKLFGRFGDEQAAEDVQRAEQIIRENPAPQPSEKLINNIKQEITAKLLRRQSHTLRRILFKAVAVAAALAVMTGISLKLFKTSDNGRQRELVTASIIPAAIWDSEDMTQDDAELATLTAEIEQIGTEVMSVHLGQTNGNGDEAIMEIEMKLVEINSDFWKG